MILEPTSSRTWSDFVRKSVLIPGFLDGNSLADNLLFASRIASENYEAGEFGIAVRGHWTDKPDIVLFLMVGLPLVTEKLEKYGLDWYLCLDRGDCVRILKDGSESACEVSATGLVIPSVGTFVFDVAYSRPANTECYGHSKDPGFFKGKDHLCDNAECLPATVKLLSG